jgi:hypothetical protein
MNVGVGLSGVVFLLSFPFLFCCQRAGPPAGSTSSPVPATIAQVRGQKAAEWVGRLVAVEGFYYGETIPMIVDDIKRVYVDRPIPTDAYLPIVGPIPSQLKTGDRVVAIGVVSRPQSGDPRQVAGERTILRVHDAAAIRVLNQATKIGT